MSEPAARVVLCVASGPSLVASDVAAARQVVDATVCANNAWEMAPDAEHLFSADRRWWRTHYRDVRKRFRGQIWTSNEWAFADFGIPLVRCDGTNSGIKAMRLALHLGARKIYLLGYDMKRGENGEKHFFGDHPRHLPNTSVETFDRWVAEMREFAVELANDGVEVVNLSRRTAIDCFPRGEV